MGMGAITPAIQYRVGKEKNAINIIDKQYIELHKPHHLIQIYNSHLWDRQYFVEYCEYHRTLLCGSDNIS